MIEEFKAVTAFALTQVWSQSRPHFLHMHIRMVGLQVENVITWSYSSKHWSQFWEHGTFLHKELHSYYIGMVYKRGTSVNSGIMILAYDSFIHNSCSMGAYQMHNSNELRIVHFKIHVKGSVISFHRMYSSAWNNMGTLHEVQHLPGSSVRNCW